MNADSIVTRGGLHVEADADPDLVLMHVESGRFFSLGGTGRRVWELIEAPVAIGALVDRLTADYAVDRTTCLRDVLTLCERLRERGLVDVAD